MNSKNNGPSRSSGGPHRRDFLKLPVAASAAQVIAATHALNAAPPRIDENSPDNIKVATMVNASQLTDDSLLFYKQIGIRWVHCQFPNEVTYEMIKSTQERLAKYGIAIHSGLSYTYRSLKVQLGQPGRDEEIAKFQTFLKDLGRLGIPTAHNDFHPANTYTTTMIESSRGYRIREFFIDDFRNKIEKQAFDRVYTADDIWANFSYYLKAVMPVAEQANVKIATHPDDPPVAMMNGVAKVLVNYDGYKHAEQIGGKNWGMCLCLGSWSEGGNNMGKDVFGLIKDFGGRGKIFTIHFRNVNSPLPRFHECFPDEGYQDMYQIVKTLRQVKFSGSMIPDHYPEIAGDANHRIYDAYNTAYMRRLVRQANEEVG